MKKIENNDVPSLRMVMHIEAIFDYLKVFSAKDKLPSDMDTICKSLQKLYINNVDNLDAKEIEKVFKDLDSIIQNNNNTLLKKIIGSIKSLFTKASTKDELMTKINAGIKEMSGLWKDIFGELDKMFKEYSDDIKVCNRYSGVIGNDMDKVSMLKESLSKFTGELNKWCEEELQKNDKIDNEDIYNKISKLIETNLIEFCTLLKKDPEKFKEICGISFLSNAIVKYLNKNNLNENSSYQLNDNIDAFTKLLEMQEANEDAEDGDIYEEAEMEAVQDNLSILDKPKKLGGENYEEFSSYVIVGEKFYEAIEE